MAVRHRRQSRGLMAIVGFPFVALERAESDLGWRKQKRLYTTYRLPKASCTGHPRGTSLAYLRRLGIHNSPRIRNHGLALCIRCSLSTAVDSPWCPDLGIRLCPSGKEKPALPSPTMTKQGPRTRRTSWSGVMHFFAVLEFCFNGCAQSSRRPCKSNITGDSWRFPGDHRGLNRLACLNEPGSRWGI